MLVQRGATLVELVMAIVIISVAIAGVVGGAFSLIAGRSADPLNQTRAIALAQFYMDEVLSRKYDDKTLPGGAFQRKLAARSTRKSRNVRISTMWMTTTISMA